jgi:acetoin utilization deacetylase AcuC-like enzyme
MIGADVPGFFILHDPSLTMAFRDYGIMLPIAPDRAGRVAESLGPSPALPVLDIPGALGFLGETGKPLIGGAPGLRPVLDRQDLERVHQRDFIAVLYGGPPGSPVPSAGLERALLNTYELIDRQGRPHRYEPERAVKPLSALFDTILAQVGGTYLACRLALAGGGCYYLGGGMHHARYDSGSGFCLVNDVVIAARKIQAENRARFIWVVDVDAHKGDGTAELVRFARERGELGGIGGLGGVPAGGVCEDPGGFPAILTLSAHMASGWPLDAESLGGARPGRAPLLPSDIDIGVEAGEEEAYVPRLNGGLLKLEELSRALYGHPGAAPGSGKPDLAIVVDGADPYEHDGLPSSGLLRLTLDHCLKRDLLIYTFLKERGIPSAWIMAGGYGDRAWEPPARFLGSLAMKA